MVDTQQDWPRRRFYGIAEIAEALGVDRQLVTVWRRRSSHGLPAPDEELASGPLWAAETVEAWIQVTRARLEADATTHGAATLTAALGRQTAQRLFQLTALLLEDHRQPDRLRSAIDDLGRLHAPLVDAVAKIEGSKRGLHDVVAVVRLVDQLAERTGVNPEHASPAVLDDLLAACLRVIPQVPKLLARAERD
jgi:hypothetical protein